MHNEGFSIRINSVDNPINSIQMTTRISTFGNELNWLDLTPINKPPLPGSFGVVFLAQIKESHKIVAVKIIKSALVGEIALSNLQNEARTLKKAADGNMNDYVVKLIGIAQGPASRAWLDILDIHGPTLVVGKTKDMIALVMSYEGGGNLGDLLHKNPLGKWPALTPERLRLILEIVTGLFHLHNNTEGKIIHGDIKPENVLLSGTGKDSEVSHVRLADFGLSKLISSASRSSSGMSMLQQANMARGTPNYVS